jgi:hypothetical protein
LFVGLVAMMMAAGLVLVGCKQEPDCSQNGDCKVSTNTYCSSTDCAAYKGASKGDTSAKCDC